MPVELNDVDAELVHALTLDGRASYAALGEAVGLSRSQARIRLMSLLDRGVVAVHGRLAPRFPGTGVVGFSLLRTGRDRAGVASRVASLSEAKIVAEMLGSYDVYAEIHARGLSELREVIGRIRAIDGLLAEETVLVTDFAKQSWHGLPEDRLAPDVDDHDFTADEIDRQLIELLLADGRAAYTTLAETTGLSMGATRERVLRLIDLGVVDIVVMPGALSFDRNQFFAVLIKVDGPIDDTIEAAVALPSSTAVATLTGAYDVAIESWAGDLDGFVDAMDQYRALPGVVSIVPLLYRHGRRFFDHVS